MIIMNPSSRMDKYREETALLKVCNDLSVNSQMDSHLC